MMMSFLRLAALGALLALGACASSGGSTGSLVTKTASLPAPDAPGKYATQTEYRIAPLDTLEVSVFQVPDLSRTAQVDASGQVGLPLIGNVMAAGKTVEELQTDIAGKLGAKYLESPEVTVTVKEAPSRQVTVEGAVNKPGVFAIASNTSLLQAVAMSGGLNEVANTDDITVFRTVDNKRMAAVFSAAAIRKGKANDPQVFGGDVIVVGESGSRTTFRELGKVAPILGVFSPLLY